MREIEQCEEDKQTQYIVALKETSTRYAKSYFVGSFFVHFT